jgi:hypothetical protein
MAFLDMGFIVLSTACFVLLDYYVRGCEKI